MTADALGSGLPVTGFPEFEQFCIVGFPMSTQIFVQVRCVYRFRHARMNPASYSGRRAASQGQTILLKFAGVYLEL